MRVFVGELHSVERQLRAVFAANGRLATAAAEAHAHQNLSGVAGHQVFKAISDAQGSVSEAIAQIANGHRALELLGKKLGYDVTAFGDETKPPAPNLFDGA